MALKLLAFLVFHWTYGAPDPNATINVAVPVLEGLIDLSKPQLQVQHQPSIGYGPKIKNNIGEVSVNSCMEMELMKNGEYHYTGNIDPNCEECEAWGDPHIIPFDSPAYDFHGVGTFTMTEIGLNQPAKIKVTAELDNVPGTSFSSPRNVCYFQNLEVEVCIILPSFNKIHEHCFNSTDPTKYKDCEIKVKVNSNFETIGTSVKTFGPSKSVLVFEHNHADIRNGINIDTKCINIVGLANDLSICLCLSNKAYYYSNLFIWAMPSLKGQLYGLCNTYIDKPQPLYTMQDGSTTTNTTEFAYSWQRYGDYTITPDVYNCNTSEWKDISRRCAKITKGACELISEKKCDAFYAACVYDLCRVPNPGQYAQAYADHMLIEENLNQ